MLGNALFETFHRMIGRGDKRNDFGWHMVDWEPSIKPLEVDALRFCDDGPKGRQLTIENDP